MARLPDIKDPTLEAADRALEEKENANQQRGYLGMSAIGHPCSRKLWYGFRLASPSSFDAATLKRFADGHYSEDVQAARLQAVEGITLKTRDPNTGEQFACKDHAGHFRGHLDGLIHGLLQAPSTEHVWEHKATAEKNMAALAKAIHEHGEKSALEVWNGIYFGQAQVYMHYTGKKRHYLTVASAGSRSVISCRTNYNPVVAETLIAKALDIITANEPPPKIGGPDFYQCKWCEHHAICHGKDFAQVSCRTCAHSTPTLQGDAAWQCAKFPGEPIPMEVQRKGCSLHVYRPDLVPAEMIDASEEENSATYKTAEGVLFKNGGDGAKSTTLCKGGLAVAADPFSKAS